MSRELHLEERPVSFKQVVGQQAATAQLVGMAKGEGIPHCLLFTGPSGCGKTTIARIVRAKLKCSDNDFFEINAAETRGIDMVRGIQSRMTLSPLGGKCRVYLIDECHQLTADAQGALLKMLEEPPAHVYFMLATTHPEKLRKAIRTRSTEIKVRALTEAEITGLVTKVADSRDVELPAAVVTKLADVADGSARKALVLLQQVLGITDEDQQLKIIHNADASRDAIEICRALLAGKDWRTVAKIIQGCDAEAEGVRRLMLVYMTKVVLGGGRGADRAVEIIEEFEDNFFDSGRAGLVAACYRCCS